MYMLLLFILVIITLVIIFNYYKKDILEPSLIFCLSFVPLTFMALLNSKKWSLGLHLNTLLVIILGIIEFFCVGILMKRIVGKAKKEKTDFGFISPKTIWTDRTLCKMNVQSDLEGKFIDENTKNLTKISRCTFVSCFLPTKIVLEVGLPIKEFFIWADDTEYTLRISKKHPCYYINTCEVLHKMNNNNPTRIETDIEARIERYFYSFRNRFYIAKKQGILKVIRYHLSICKTILNILIKSKSKKIKRLSIVLKGYFKGIVFNPTIERIN